MHCKFPAYFLYTTGKSLCTAAHAASQPPSGWLLRKEYLKVQTSGVTKNEKAMKLNAVHAKILEWTSLANRYLQQRFCLQEEKATLHLFNFTCSVWSDLSMIKHNYFNVNQWASRHPETVITRHSQPVCKFHWLWHCSPFIEIKSNVCCKTTYQSAFPVWLNH